MIKLQTDGHAVGARARFCLTEKAMSIGRDCEGERGDAFSPDPYMRTMHVKHLAPVHSDITPTLEPESTAQS